MRSEEIRSLGTASVPRNAVWERELPAACEPADPWAEIELEVNPAELARRSPELPPRRYVSGVLARYARLAGSAACVARTEA